MTAIDINTLAPQPPLPLQAATDYSDIALDWARQVPPELVLAHVEAELREGRLFLPYGPAVPSGEAYWIAVPEARAHRPELMLMRDWLLREARGADTV